MGNLHKELLKCKHPNSRKTKALAKKAKQMNNKHKQRLGHAIKSNITGEKLTWFLNHLGSRTNSLSPKEFADLFEMYLKRFDEEIEQIKLKQSISKNRYNQHVARENAIKMTLEREINEYNGGGIEMVNLCDTEKLKALLQWDGNAVNIQHLKLNTITKAQLQRLDKSSS